MGTASAVAVGALAGIVGSVPSAILFEFALKRSARVNLAAGIASVFVSFLVLSGALLAVYLREEERLLEFGCAMVASFLLFWAIEALRAWRVANGRG